MRDSHHNSEILRIRARREHFWGMPRQRRVVLAGRPHHITQRGNNRRDVFFEDSDRELCPSLLKEYTPRIRWRFWVTTWWPITSTWSRSRLTQLAYVERNAVRAGMVAHCEEWAGSSARLRFASQLQRHVFVLVGNICQRTVAVPESRCLDSRRSPPVRLSIPRTWFEDLPG